MEDRDKQTVFAVTFALHPLAEDALQETLAELADGWTGVGVHGEGVRDFDPTQDHLLHPDGATAQQRVTFPCAQQGALLRTKTGEVLLFIIIYYFEV